MKAINIEGFYEELPDDAWDECDTYVIAFCPDTDSFFAINQRNFYWETDEEFETEYDAIEYFESNLNHFANIHDRIMSEMFARADYGRGKSCLFLENTNKTYKVNKR